MMSKKTNYPALMILIMVFFFWGFVAASNGILIPFCQHHFSLSNFESQLLGSSFFGAYFIGSLSLYLLSSSLKFDVVNKMGYKKTIIVGLLISIVGALFMIPSTNANSFPMMLGSLFVIALGFSLQQTAAQPFVISLGDDKTGSHRLNLAGGINSLGTTVGPIIVSYFLFGDVLSKTEPTPTNINILYTILAVVFGFVALVFSLSKLPTGKNDEALEHSPKATRSLLGITFAVLSVILIGQFFEISKIMLFSLLLLSIMSILLISNSNAIKSNEGWGAMQYPQLVYGMFAIFIYVGVEVTIDNNFGALLRLPGYLTPDGLSEEKISKYISLYWGSLMIGRWIGALSVFKMNKAIKLVATIIVPFVAFAIIIYSNALKGSDMSDLYNYGYVILFAILAFILSNDKPVATMIMVSSFAVISMLIGLFTSGIVSVYAFMAGGLFCSVMWPCIFSLAIMGLNKYSSQGSSFLIMMILGGAIIPPFQGAIGDSLGVHFSYVIAVVCFIILIVLTLLMQRTLKAQGFDLDKLEQDIAH